MTTKSVVVEEDNENDADADVDVDVDEKTDARHLSLRNTNQVSKAARSAICVAARIAARIAARMVTTEDARAAICVAPKAPFRVSSRVNARVLAILLTRVMLGCLQGSL